MGMRFITPSDPSKPRTVEFFNPTTGKKLGVVKLPPRTEDRSATKGRSK